MNIAITGGIGSGKSYVCHLLAQQGIQVYDCDAAAKQLMNHSLQLRQQLTQLIGDEVYTTDGRLCKRVLAKYLLASERNKMAVNDIVHPAVAADFLHSGKHWLESAILFESGFYKRIDFDYVVCVTAPEKLRVERIVKRDGINREQALQWINSQMNQEEKLERSDFQIINDGQIPLNPQIEHILNKINNNLK